MEDPNVNMRTEIHLRQQIQELTELIIPFRIADNL